MVDAVRKTRSRAWRVPTVWAVIVSVMLGLQAAAAPVVYAGDQPDSRAGSVLRLRLDIHRLADEWMDRQGITNRVERELLRIVSIGSEGKRIDRATCDCASYVTIVDVAHPKRADWPERFLEIRPENPELDTFKLLAYRSTTIRDNDPVLASVIVICIEDHDRPKVIFESQMRYVQSRWEISQDRDPECE